MARQKLCWGAAGEVEGVQHLQKAAVKVFADDDAGRRNLENKVSDGLDGGLGMAVALQIVQRRHYVMNTPSLYEVPELGAGELGSPIGPELKRNNDLQKVPTEDPGSVGSSNVSFAWDDNRPSRKPVGGNEKGDFFLLLC